MQPNLNARPTVATVHSPLIGRSRTHGVGIPAAIGQNWLSVTREGETSKGGDCAEVRVMSQAGPSQFIERIFSKTVVT